MIEIWLWLVYNKNNVRGDLNINKSDVALITILSPQPIMKFFVCNIVWFFDASWANLTGFNKMLFSTLKHLNLDKETSFPIQFNLGLYFHISLLIKESSKLFTKNNQGGSIFYSKELNRVRVSCWKRHFEWQGLLLAQDHHDKIVKRKNKSQKDLLVWIMQTGQYVYTKVQQHPTTFPSTVRFNLFLKLHPK